MREHRQLDRLKKNNVNENIVGFDVNIEHDRRREEQERGVVKNSSS